MHNFYMLIYIFPKTEEHAVIKSSAEKRVQNRRKTTSGDYLHNK